MDLWKVARCVLIKNYLWQNNGRKNEVRKHICKTEENLLGRKEKSVKRGGKWETADDQCTREC